ncbi:MAG: valine--tRNA ligase [Patescibacteria group bacterium]
MKELPKTYNPQEIETKIYRAWEKSGFFNPDKLPVQKTAKNYTIVIPPPNITGELHIGHALNNTIQDILIRWKRMQGYQALWVPGTDHAGIATQNVVEKDLKKQGLTRHDLGRKKFLERVWAWRKKYGDLILEQLKKLGCSCDWSRAAFTMDPGYQKAVEQTFLHYYKKGWIYKGERMVNWCPRCQTSLSDLELEYKEEKSHLWYIKYPLVNGQGHIIVATTRPETMLGDTAVAVHPDDKRYKNLIGKKVNLPLTDRKIPIIADKEVSLEFGTGAVKITPAHSPIDIEIGQRHHLESIQVISDKGRMTKQAGKDFASLSILDARKKVVEELKEQGLLGKIEDYLHQAPHCYRCDNMIEPLISLQWFVKMDKLAKTAIKAVKSGQIKFHPKRWEKVYFDWLNNIKDWCISRQIWWGHKIPLEGETDVLDTWFSSALWPLATLGWPKKTKDLKEYYPTDTLSTARDIINLWVARMIFSGLELVKKIPFKDVFIHPTIFNKQGKRMSKSLGTGVDPLNLIKEFGADATRFGLAYQVLQSQDIRFSEENILMGKKFANKIWNASRFVLMVIASGAKQSRRKNGIAASPSAPRNDRLTAADKKILKQLKSTIQKMTADLEKFRFGQAAHLIYDFFWRDFCDKYIEQAKSEIRNPKSETKNVLSYVLLTSLKLLHPFMPFVTESIYQKLPFKEKQFLMIEDWPK